jgi:hypothetical protein
MKYIEYLQVLITTSVFRRGIKNKIMRVLHLTLKKKWFDMIASGEKKEEYRDIKDYWKKRLLEEPLIDDWSFKKYTHAEFKNGYPKDAPKMVVEIKSIDYGFPKMKWSDYGAWEGDVFVIKLGRIINPSNQK